MTVPSRFTDWHTLYSIGLICKTFEFFLNDFLWIQRIQWIVTKSKSGIVIRDILYLSIDIFFDVVVKENVPLLFVGWYLFTVVSGSKYLPIDSIENALYMTSTGNHTTFGFCHDSLNSANLVKFTSEKLYYLHLLGINLLFVQ